VTAVTAGSRSASELGRRSRSTILAPGEIRVRRLVRLARRGDRGARARLVEAYLPLVRAIASRYRDYGLPLDDLVQEGSIGLLGAIDHYDASRSCEFEAYARFRVRRAIRNALTEQARLIRLPKQIVERRRALARAEAGLLAAGRRVTPADLAAATGVSVASVIEARGAAQASVSLDQPTLPDGSPLESLVVDPAAADPAEAAVRHEREELLERAVARLPERQRCVVDGKWGLDGAPETSATDLARVLRLSPRRTQRIGQDALHALRRELELADAGSSRRGSHRRVSAASTLPLRFAGRPSPGEAVRPARRSSPRLAGSKRTRFDRPAGGQDEPSLLPRKGDERA
jgi:RNA polymerase primary sigma factor